MRLLKLSGSQGQVLWLSPEKFSEIFGIHPQTLANQRYKDRKAGFPNGRPGYPQYQRFGKAVRYRIVESA